MNIMFTNVRKNGEPCESENVIVFTRLSQQVVEAAFRNEGSMTWDECYPVRDDELQYYLYEPCHLSEAEERRAMVLAKQTPGKGE